jgi:hypothetical protein
MLMVYMIAFQVMVVDVGEIMCRTKKSPPRRANDRGHGAEGKTSMQAKRNGPANLFVRKGADGWVVEERHPGDVAGIWRGGYFRTKAEATSHQRRLLAERDAQGREA